ncbi:MAG: DUF4251 domain-containing protein [Tannerella sp.]|jgi:hypothetical protein|nr:DUF4251 domain-containing protein [Tannerella sp.]
MKTVSLFWIGTMLVLAATLQTSCSSSRTAVNSEQAQAVKQQIESRRYRISVNRMLPMKGPSQYLTSSYSLTVRGDTVISYLPYFGQAYSLPYGGGKGLNFESTVTVYSLSFDAKGTARISFQTRSENETFLYLIEIFVNGSSSIRVTSSNRQSVSFYGALEPEEAPPAVMI